MAPSGFSSIRCGSPGDGEENVGSPVVGKRSINVREMVSGGNSSAGHVFKEEVKLMMVQYAPKEVKASGTTVAECANAVGA